jgi:hypothetical protein
MTLINAGLQLFAILVLLLSGRVVTDQRSGGWSVTESFNVLPTLHCSFVLQHGEFAGTCDRDGATGEGR